MAFRFVIGRAGSGKTGRAISYLLEESEKNPKGKYYYISPEQFGLEAQKTLCALHPRHSVMRVEILSFERLAFMVFKELGIREKPVLNDTGKNLILRKIAGDNEDKLQVLKPYTRNLSYIDEVKSLISEFMQYGINYSDIENIIGKSGNTSLFNAKASDILFLYKSFISYLSDSYDTEETGLNLFLDNMEKSEMLRNGVFVFDGYTGFTPLQNLIIEKLLKMAKEVLFTVTIDPLLYKFSDIHEDELYFMSKTMMRTIRKMDKKELAAFKIEGGRTPKEIRITETASPKNELKYCAYMIKKLVKEEGLRYKNIAILSGDMDRFLPYIEEIFDPFDIPIFKDKSITLDYHPFLSFLGSLRDLMEYDFKAEHVIRFIRTGLCKLSFNSQDKFTNYIKATGIRGFSAYKKDFFLRPAGTGDEDLVLLNEIRESFVEPFLPFINSIKNGDCTFKEIAVLLYEFIAKYEIENSLFESGDEDIYRLVMDNLDGICDFLPDEKGGFGEFMDILFAGLSGSKLGKLPKYSDMVIFGDTVRTRVDNIDTLFVIGANEGVLPKVSVGGGLFSELDRLRLKNLGLTLAPPERERQFAGVFYMELLFSRPKSRLFVSYCVADSSGETLRPSFVINDLIKKHENLRIYREDSLVESFDEVKRINESLLSSDVKEVSRTVSKEILKELNRGELNVSVSKLESFNRCSYAYFLKYILKLGEEQLYGMNPIDFGNVYHDSIYNFFAFAKERGLTINEISEAERSEIIKDSFSLAVNTVKTRGDYSHGFDDYVFGKMEKTIEKTVDVLIDQVSGGDFRPESFETELVTINTKEELKLQLDDGSLINLTGKIDRIDLNKTEDSIFIKIVDYKSGNKEFDFSLLKGGLQIQLLYYMDAKRKALIKENPDKEILPSAVFYYHIDNPVVELSKEYTKEEIHEKFLASLKPTGLILNEKEVVEALDKKLANPGTSSNLVNLSTKVDGSLKSSGSLLSKEDMDYLLEFVEKKVKETAELMRGGDIKKNPYRYGDKNGCDYCGYRSICGFDESMGDRFKDIEKISSMEEFKKDGI